MLLSLQLAQGHYITSIVEDYSPFFHAWCATDQTGQEHQLGNVKW